MASLLKWIFVATFIFVTMGIMQKLPEPVQSIVNSTAHEILPQRFLISETQNNHIQAAVDASH